jgi:hypothetical protein
MFHLLYKYFVLNRHLSIPGIGVFVLEREAARVDAGLNTLHAPMPVVRFKMHGAQMDNSFYGYLAKELGIEVLDAIQEYHDFAIDLKNEVQEKKWIELPNLGILTQGVKDEIKFKSSPVLKDYFPDVAAENISTVSHQTVEAEEPVTVGATEEKVRFTKVKKEHDYWWVFAILLALIGIGAIVYYYYNFGSPI